MGVSRFLLDNRHGKESNMHDIIHLMMEMDTGGHIERNLAPNVKWDEDVGEWQYLDDDNVETASVNNEWPDERERARDKIRRMRNKCSIVTIHCTLTVYLHFQIDICRVIICYQPHVGDFAD